MSYMELHSSPERRLEPRVRVELFFNQYIREQPFRSLAVNLSEHGLALRRLVEPVTVHARVVGVELALPGTAEVIWAKAETEFEAIGRDFHATGVRFVAMARKHERLIRDFVQEKNLRAQSWWRRSQLAALSAAQG